MYNGEKDNYEEEEKFLEELERWEKYYDTDDYEDYDACNEWNSL